MNNNNNSYLDVDSKRKEITLKEKSEKYIKASTSDSTRKAYQKAIKHFLNWGGQLPADTNQILLYLTDYAESLNPRSLSLHITAIRNWHLTQNLTDPTHCTEVKHLMKGIRRIHGKPKQKARTFNLETLEEMINLLKDKDTLASKRDLAILLIGFLGGFRRSELATLDLKNIRFEDSGLLVTLAKSKTDQEGEGIEKGIPYGSTHICPVTALKEWLLSANITEGPLFRAVTRWGKVDERPLYPSSINRILKKIASDIGLTPEFIEYFSSHSLRRSMSTNAHNEDASFDSIKRQGGWRYDGTVRGYIDYADIFKDNAAGVLLNKLNENN